MLIMRVLLLPCPSICYPDSQVAALVLPLCLFYTPISNVVP